MILSDYKFPVRWLSVGSYPGTSTNESPRERGSVASREETVAVDPLQVELVDEPLIEEIQLLADLIVAAAAAPGRLAQRAIDAVLSL